MEKYKRFILMLSIMMLCFTSVGFNNKVDAASLPSVSAHAYVIMDSNSGEILYSKDAYKKIYPASTAKMMTALVAIENCDLSKKITITNTILNSVPSIATQANLKAGYSYTLEELLNMLLVYSAADAANAIAFEVGGSISGFTKMMNDRAKSLGMNSTNFDNAIGLDGRSFPNTYCNAVDIANLTKYVMKNPIIRDIVKKPSYTIKNYDNGKSKTLNNSNNFLRNKWYPKDLYTVIGTKTGTTDAAGYALSTTAIDKNGREIICSFFGNSTRTKMFEDIEKLLTYTYRNFKPGWKRIEDKWYYYEKSGAKKTGWLKDNNKWYYLNEDGSMAIGWKRVSNEWYYLEQNGEMRTGWLKDSSGKWYYLNENGSMAKGWKKVSNEWYYLEQSGEMRTGWLKDSSGKWYYLNEDGSMAKGWKKVNNEWYYLEQSGEMRTGWLKYNNEWYYLEVDGSMATNAVIDGWEIDSNGIATIIEEQIS